MRARQRGSRSAVRTPPQIHRGGERPGYSDRLILAPPEHRATWTRATGGVAASARRLVQARSAEPASCFTRCRDRVRQTARARADRLAERRAHEACVLLRCRRRPKLWMAIAATFRDLMATDIVSVKVISDRQFWRLQEFGQADRYERPDGRDSDDLLKGVVIQ